jgi:carboxylesterase
MGTLFSIQNAVRLPEKVKALFLLCSPLSVRLHPRSAKYSLRIIFEQTDGSDAVENSARKWYSIKPDKNLWKYLPWVPKFTSLLNEIRKTKILVDDISSPTVVFHARHDSLVSKNAIKPFLKNDKIEVNVLPSSYHQHFSDEDYKTITNSFSKMMNDAIKNDMD